MCVYVYVYAFNLETFWKNTQNEQWLPVNEENEELYSYYFDFFSSIFCISS